MMEVDSEDPIRRQARNKKEFERIFGNDLYSHLNMDTTIVDENNNQCSEHSRDIDPIRRQTKNRKEFLQHLIKN